MRALSILLLLLTVGFSPVAEAKGGDVNLINCSIFDSSGKLLKMYRAWLCAFFPNGKMLLGDGATLTFYDQKMNIVWAKDMHVHGSITYSEADDTALLQVSHVLPGDLRGDRLEVYDQEGKLIKHFNFTSKHAFKPQEFNYDRFMLPSRVKEEVHHVWSFYRIGRNRSKLPFLREGNYVVADAFGVIYFLDSKLQKIVHTIHNHKLGISNLRDVQVTERGNLLAYNSGNVDAQGQPYSSLDEINPTTGKFIWRYIASPPTSFYGPSEGNVQELPNGNFLYSLVMDERKGKERRHVPQEELEPWMLIQGGHQSIEITRDGKEVWKMISHDDDLSGKPNVVKRQNLDKYFSRKKRY
ncbi:MAG: hypothetical protein AB7K68_06975 [Bacteriovoracia bacterium]